MRIVKQITPNRTTATGRGDFRSPSPKVSLVFDEDVFNVLAERAKIEGTTFGAQVRRVLRRALIT
jgi:hypothetical protein